MIKFSLTYVLVTVFLMSVSSLSHAHSYEAKNKRYIKSGVKIMPIAHVQNKLLPKALYVKTAGHTYKRKFAYQNLRVKDVFYSTAQQTPKIYATLMTRPSYKKSARSYWP